MAKLNSRPDDDWRISYEGMSMEQSGSAEGAEGEARYWPDFSVVDDDCMAACERLGIHDTKSAEFTFRSFIGLNQANKNDCIAGKSFLGRL